MISYIVDWLFAGNTSADFIRREDERFLIEFEAEQIALAEKRNQELQQRAKYKPIDWSLYDRPFTGSR